MMHVWIVASWAIGGLAALAFCGLYQVLAPWRESPVGRHMMAFGASVAVVLLVIWARTEIGPVVWLDWLRLLAGWAVALLLVQRCWLLVRAQRCDRRPDFPADRPGSSREGETRMGLVQEIEDHLGGILARVKETLGVAEHQAEPTVEHDTAAVVSAVEDAVRTATEAITAAVHDTLGSTPPAAPVSSAAPTAADPAPAPPAAG